MDLGLRNRIALVTGGSYGIGRAIALALADEGCRVAICARGEERLQKTAADIRARKTECLAIAADATVAADAKRVVDAVTQTWNGLHILVNNVGGGVGHDRRSVEEVPEEQWLEAYERNAFAAVR